MKKIKTKICKSCGAENPTQAKYCQVCGKEIKSTKSKVLKIVLTIIAIIAIIFIGLVVWAYYSFKADEKREAEANMRRLQEIALENVQTDSEQSQEEIQSNPLPADKPQLTPEERSEKEQLLKNKLSKLKLITDNFTESRSYYSVNTPTDKEYWYYDTKTFLSPVIRHIGDDYELDVISNYYGDDWLFIDNVAVKVDGEFYFPYNDIMKPKFEHKVCGGGYVSENCFNSVKKLDGTLVDSEYYPILYKMANGQNVVVRFSGKNGNKDLIIDKDRQAIKDVLDAWDLIVELYGQ